MTALIDAIQPLQGCRVTRISRTLNIVVIEFKRESGNSAAGLPKRLHAQCAFRAVRGGQILLGSYDMN
jgi:hypothetical protein